MRPYRSPLCREWDYELLKPYERENIATILAGGSVLLSGRAAEAGRNECRGVERDRYVEGVRLIAEARRYGNRADEVLSLVEAGARGQADRIAAMESHLKIVKNVVRSLENEARPGCCQVRICCAKGGALMSDSMRWPLPWLTTVPCWRVPQKAVDAELAEADKSGKIAERRLAEQSAAELNVAAENLHLLVGRLAQVQLRVGLEYTLLKGLQPKAASDGADIRRLPQKEGHLSEQVAVQRNAVDKLTNSLSQSRVRLAAKTTSLASR